MMHVQTVLLDTSWLYNVWEMFLLFIKSKFLWKNGVSEKIKAHLSQQPPPSSALQLFSPHLFYFIQKLLVPPLFKKESRDYAFYMWDYNNKGIAIL